MILVGISVLLELRWVEEVEDGISIYVGFSEFPIKSAIVMPFYYAYEVFAKIGFGCASRILFSEAKADILEIMRIHCFTL